MELYDYLLKTYGVNEPIFISNIQYKGMTMNYIRQQVKKLTDQGLLKRYDTGIYFIPTKTIFKSGSTLSREKVIEQKYLTENGTRCGYIGALTFANQLGLTTQLSAKCEIVTNKATSDYREVKLAASTVILKKPRVTVTEDNYRELQLLDLIKDIDYFSESDPDAQLRRILAYMKELGMGFSNLKPWLPFYPDKIYKNMYEMGMLNFISL
ncbi:MAG: hypothetical protein LUE29_05275 [Lachnospiraceae bacterium]|nr:hypothetical protein [Lachnospiraceae bacterium]